MSRINRYIGRAVLTASLGSLGVIVGLDALTALVDEVGKISSAYQFGDVLIYVFFTLPRRVYEYIPFACLIGALMGLGKLAASSELVVIRTGGRSLLQIAGMTLRPAMLMALLGFVVGEWVAPTTEQIAVSQKAMAQRKQASMTSAVGAWNRDQNTFVHVAAVQRGGVAFDVSLLEYDDQQQLKRSVRAERGTYLQSYWLLENVEATRFDADRVSVESLTTLRWDTAITPNLLALEVVEKENLPVTQLWDYARYLEQQGLMFRDVELAFWRKLLQPMAIVGLVLIAMSFIFGPLREGNMARRIFAGVIVAVIFRISQDFFGPASLLFGFPVLLSALTPILFCILIGAWLLTRKA